MLDHANNILAQIKDLKCKLDFIQKQADEEMKAIREKYESISARLTETLREKEKELTGLLKKNKAEIFDGRDKVTLSNGILLYGKETKVSIPRDALAKIEAQGWMEAVKIAKSVDRSVVEKWSEERLFVIGAKRRLVEKFAYELR